MTLLIKNATVVSASGEKRCDIAIKDRIFAEISENISGEFDKVIDASGLHAFPGFIDIHCHLRDPGFEYKEDIVSGTRAAAKGGFTAVCCMANTQPVNDNAAVTKYIIEKAEKEGSGVSVYPIGAITKGLNGKELAEIGFMKAAGAVAISDDGLPVSSGGIMRLAMEYSQYFNMPVISHPEDLSITQSGVMNEGSMSTMLGLKGINRAAEEAMIARDVLLAEALGKPVHIAHVSTRGGVDIIRAAKARGVLVSAETAPHYLAADETWVEGYNTRAKVNPPLRCPSDSQAIIEGLLGGTIDCIATDHAPHHRDEKDVEFALAASGISGFETAFAVCYTVLVKSGKATVSQLAHWLSCAPAKILSLPSGSIEPGQPADMALADLSAVWTVNPDEFLSKGKNTLFAGRDYFGKIKATIAGGTIIYDDMA